MNAAMSAHTAAMAAFAPSAQVAAAGGRAFILQIEPDLSAFERINVGVAIIKADGRRLVKVLSDFSRVECLYGEQVTTLCEFLTDLAKESFLQARTNASPCLHSIDAQPFYNVEAEVYLEQLFARVVPAARPRREARESAGQRDGDQLRTEVTSIIRLQAPGLADSLIANTPFTRLMTRTGVKEVFIPLQPSRGAGSIESADFSAQTARLKLMAALLDVETAAAARNLPKTGLFIGRPARSRRPADLVAIDAAIDFVASRAPSSCRVEVSDSAQFLASAILDWAEAA